MSGEVFRLKNWTDYRQKLAKGEPGMISEGFKTRPGMHTVVVTLGAIGETEPLTEEWVKAHMRGLGWVPISDVTAAIDTEQAVMASNLKLDKEL